MMGTDSRSSWSAGIRRKHLLLVAACLVITVFGTSGLVCTVQYERSRDRLLLEQKNALESWLAGTMEAVELWLADLDSQAQRITGSELCQLVAPGMTRRESNAASLINNEQPIIDETVTDQGEFDQTETGDPATLAGQVPMMRKLLLDFMNFNGFSDARIASARGQPLLSALAHPLPLLETQQQTIAAAVKRGKTAFAPVRGTQAGLILDMAAPVESLLSEDGTETSATVLLISTPVTAQITRLLARNMRQSEKARPRLVQQRGAVLEELRVESAQPVAVREGALPLDTTGNMPFGHRPALDGEGSVYSMGLHVPALGWWLTAEIPADETNGLLRAQAWKICSIGVVVGLGVVLLFALLWWIVVGREQRAVAERFQALYTVIRQQKQLLDSVNVSLEMGLIMIAPDGGIQVCNRAFSQIVKREEAELPGMSLTALFPVDVCGRLLAAIRRVEDSRVASSLEVTLPGSSSDLSRPEDSPPDHAGKDEERLFRVTLYPFMEHQGEHQGQEGGTDGVVATFQDITRFRRDSERRRLQQANTIAALIHAIESVDPHLKGHSRMMGELAELIGRQMQLNDRDRDTIRTAASLSQTGKLFVPRDLLTKTGQLTEEEQTELRRAPGYAHNILRDINFGLPVATAVYEMSERMDGTGYPQGLSGDEISIHARVLAVVNAFCAMVSPRSFRSGMSVSEALSRLRKDEGIDPAVVEALDAVLRTPEGIRIATSSEE